MPGVAFPGPRAQRDSGTHLVHFNPNLDSTKNPEKMKPDASRRKGPSCFQGGALHLPSISDAKRTLKTTDMFRFRTMT